MTGRSRCRDCGAILLPQRSVLDLIASKMRYCPFCMEIGIAEQKARDQRSCDHAWGAWEGGPGHWTRICVRCDCIHISYTEASPEPPPDFDISWCDLDRTVPEP